MNLAEWEQINIELLTSRQMGEWLGRRDDILRERIKEKIKRDLLRYEADCQLTADSQTCMKCSADFFKSVEKIIDRHISLRGKA